MRISEAIAILQAAQGKYGNLRIYVEKGVVSSLKIYPMRDGFNSERPEKTNELFLQFKAD